MYTPPEWGLDGANAFGIYVEAIKGGVVVENMTLPMDSSKSCVVAGVCVLIVVVLLHLPVDANAGNLMHGHATCYRNRTHGARLRPCAAAPVDLADARGAPV